MSIRKLVVPIIHHNGSSRNDIMKQLKSAYSALKAAREAIRMVEMNERDFYVHPIQGAGLLARKQRNAWLASVDEIQKDLAMIGSAVLRNQSTVEVSALAQREALDDMEE